MPASSFALVRVLHVLAAALTLGGLATLPVARSKVQGAGDSRFATYGLDVMGRIERWVVAPGAVGMLVFGLAMVEGPLARFSFTAPGAGWLHVGATLWTTLAAGLVYMASVRGDLEEEAQLGATGGDPVRGLWRRWSLAWGVAVVSVVGGVAAMALRLGA